MTIVCGLKTLDIMLGVTRTCQSPEHSLYTKVYNEILNPRDDCNVLRCLNTCILLFFKVKYRGIASKEKSAYIFHRWCCVSCSTANVRDGKNNPIGKNCANLKRLKTIVLRQ